MPKQVYDNWTKGLWTAGPPDKAPQGYLTRLTNMQVMDEGTIQTRAGTTVLYPVAGTTDGGYIANQHFFKDATGEIFTSTGLAPFTVTDTGIIQSGDRIVAASGLTVGVTNETVYFPICMKKWSNFSVAGNWGISVKPSKPTAKATTTDGDLVGDYYYRLTFFNSTDKTESAPSDASTEVEVTNKTIIVSGIDTVCADLQVDKVRIYRTTGSLSTVWYLFAEIPLGTSAWEDTLSDLEAGDTLDLYMIAPIECSIAGKYKSRLVTVGGTTGRYAYYTYGGFPEHFNSLQYEQILDPGDIPEVIVESGDAVYVFGQSSIYTVQVASTGQVLTTKVVAGRGTINGRTLSMGFNGLYFVSDDGIYLTQGSMPQRISILVDALFRGVDRAGMSNIADNTKCDGAFTGGRYYFTYYGDDAVWHTLVLREDLQRWKHYTGWKWVCSNVTGSRPVVGLPGAVGVETQGATDDCGVAFLSECGFNLGTQLGATVLKDIRTWRCALSSTGTVTVAFYDNGTLVYSTDIVAPSYADSDTKRTIPQSLSYFNMPEVRFSSMTPFTLDMFEIDIEPVRKYEADYTRQTTGAETVTGQQ